jgi:hypothetical protein
MKSNLIFSCLLICFFTILTALADEWSWPEETDYNSSSGNYVFKTCPEKKFTGPGHCQGTLFKVNGKKKKEIWSRCLINNAAPFNVFVSDSGEYVVTMDESGQLGTLPLVIYGRNGSLVAVHSTESLGLLKDDILNIKMSVSSFWWSEDSISFFGPEDKVFFIRLHWKKIMTVNLSDGRLCDKNYIDSNDRIRSYADDKIRKITIVRLNSKLPEERSTGALVAGQLCIRETIPRLKELLEDNSSYDCKSGDDPWQTVYYIRKRAKEALEQMGVTVEGIVTEEKRKQSNSLL